MIKTDFVFVQCVINNQNRRQDIEKQSIFFIYFYVQLALGDTIKNRKINRKSKRPRLNKYTINLNN